MTDRRQSTLRASNDRWATLEALGRAAGQRIPAGNGTPAHVGSGGR